MHTEQAYVTDHDLYCWCDIVGVRESVRVIRGFIIVPNREIVDSGYD